VVTTQSFPTFPLFSPSTSPVRILSSPTLGIGFRVGGEIVYFPQGPNFQTDLVYMNLLLLLFPSVATAALANPGRLLYFSWFSLYDTISQFPFPPIF